MTDDPMVDVAAAIRLEYGALRDQIAEADRTCVVMLGALITATLALTNLSIMPPRPGVAWLLAPLWLIGHVYLAEKRSVILHTAHYLLTEVEPRQEGLQWETWHHQEARRSDQTMQNKVRPVRYYPFYTETLIASVVVMATPFFVAYLSRGPITNIWIAVSTGVALLFAAVVVRNTSGYVRFERHLASLTHSGVRETS